MTAARLTSTMICAANETALKALRLAGVPLAKAQRLILSKKWRDELRENVALKVKQIEKGDK